MESSRDCDESRTAVRDSSPSRARVRSKIGSTLGLTSTLHEPRNPEITNHPYASPNAHALAHDDTNVHDANAPALTLTAVGLGAMKRWGRMFFASPRRGFIRFSPAFTSCLAGVLACAEGANELGQLRILTTALPPGTVGEPYWVQLIAMSTTSTIHWSAERLPDRLRLDGAVLSGVPDAEGVFDVSLTASDGETTVAFSAPWIVRSISEAPNACFSAIDIGSVDGLRVLGGFGDGFEPTSASCSAGAGLKERALRFRVNTPKVFRHDHYGVRAVIHREDEHCGGAEVHCSDEPSVVHLSAGEYVLTVAARADQLFEFSFELLDPPTNDSCETAWPLELAQGLRRIEYDARQSRSSRDGFAACLPDEPALYASFRLDRRSFVEVWNAELFAGGCGERMSFGCDFSACYGPLEPGDFSARIVGEGITEFSRFDAAPPRLNDSCPRASSIGSLDEIQTHPRQRTYHSANVPEGSELRFSTPNSWSGLVAMGAGDCTGFTNEMGFSVLAGQAFRFAPPVPGGVVFSLADPRDPCSDVSSDFAVRAEQVPREAPPAGDECGDAPLIELAPNVPRVLTASLAAARTVEDVFCGISTGAAQNFRLVVSEAGSLSVLGDGLSLSLLGECGSSTPWSFSASCTNYISETVPAGTYILRTAWAGEGVLMPEASEISVTLYD